MDLEDRLPRVVETEWRGGLPLAQAYLDRDRKQPRPGFQTFGTPPLAAIWYSEDTDAVMVHRNWLAPAHDRPRLEAAVAALRLEVARW